MPMEEDVADQPLIPLTRYLICNDSGRACRYGQVDTDENLLIRSGELQEYAWRSPRARLLLHVCVEGGLWRWCEPFALDANNGAEQVRHLLLDGGVGRVAVFVTCTSIGASYIKVGLYSLILRYIFDAFLFNHTSIFTYVLKYCTVCTTGAKLKNT